MPTTKSTNKQLKNSRTRNGKKISIQRKSKAVAPRAPIQVQTPVSTVCTAPVAIGNSIRGSASNVRGTPAGVIVSGRDFAFTAKASGSIQTWTLVGGAPLTPAVFADTVLRQYMQMYQMFRWRSVIFHYITSSSTSSTGDVLLYYGKNRDSVFLNQTSSGLLPFVLSDKNTILGPQWVNHSAAMEVTSNWLSTDYGMGDDLASYAAGEVFLLSKTSTTDSPGYVLMDYDVEFAGMQLSPRLLTLPLPRGIYSQANFGATSAAVTAGNQVSFGVLGNDISGTSATLPSGFAVMDIYKIVIDATNSTSGSWTACTLANLLKSQTAGGTTSALTLSDGFTCYAVAVSATTIALFPNATSAYSLTNYFVYGVTATVTYNLQIWMSLIGTAGSSNFVPSY